MHGLFHSPAIPPSLSMSECGARGCASCCTAYPLRFTIHRSVGPALLVYLRADVGPWGLLAVVLPAPFAPPCLCPGCLSPPLLPVWVNVSSLSPWLWDFCAVPVSVSSGCFCFKIVVVLLMVVQGDAVCLPMPPSWFPS